METTVLPGKTRAKQTAEAPPKPGRPFRWLPWLVAFLLVLLGGSEFWKQFYDDPNLDDAAVRAAEEEAQEVAKRHEVWIQYVLVANSTMKRPCLRCPDGVEAVTVRRGEVYKYGITSQGKARYLRKLYEALQVRMVEQVVGNYAECKTAEVNKIIAYRLLPESRKPEAKLIRPPGNAYRG